MTFDSSEVPMTALANRGVSRRRRGERRLPDCTAAKVRSWRKADLPSAARLGVGDHHTGGRRTPARRPTRSAPGCSRHTRDPGGGMPRVHGVALDMVQADPDGRPPVPRTPRGGERRRAAPSNLVPHPVLVLPAPDLPAGDPEHVGAEHRVHPRLVARPHRPEELRHVLVVGRVDPDLPLAAPGAGSRPRPTRSACCRASAARSAATSPVARPRAPGACPEARHRRAPPPSNACVRSSAAPWSRGCRVVRDPAILPPLR